MKISIAVLFVFMLFGCTYMVPKTVKLETESNQDLVQLFSDNSINISYREIDFRAIHKRLDNKAYRKGVLTFYIQVNNTTNDTIYFNRESVKLIKSFNEINQISGESLYKNIKQDFFGYVFLSLLDYNYSGQNGLRLTFVVPIFTVYAMSNILWSSISNQRLRNYSFIESGLHPIQIPPNEKIELYLHFDTEDRKPNKDLYTLKYKSI